MYDRYQDLTFRETLEYNGELELTEGKMTALLYDDEDDRANDEGFIEVGELSFVIARVDRMRFNFNSNADDYSGDLLSLAETIEDIHTANTVIYIEMVHINEDHRGKKAATNLLRHFIKRYSEFYTLIAIYPADNKPRLRSLYNGAGFDITLDKKWKPRKDTIASKNFMFSSEDPDVFEY